MLLADQARKLKSAGMRRITISLDTLRPDRFKAISQRGTHYKVIEGIEAVAAAGFTDTKLDSVVIRGFNDDELSDLIEFARNVNAEVRFIEYMDVGGATQWSMDKVFTKAQMLSTLGKKYGPIAALPKYDSAPANRYRLPDGTTFGIIASTTEPFCATCDRSRLTADGIWLHCLYALSGINLRESVRAGASANDVVQILQRGWRDRANRGAEQRLAQRTRQVFLPVSRLKRDPHLEMHTRADNSGRSGAHARMRALAGRPGATSTINPTKSRREPWHTATSVDVRSQAFTTCAAAGCRLSPTGSCPRG